MYLQLHIIIFTDHASLRSHHLLVCFLNSQQFLCWHSKNDLYLDAKWCIGVLRRLMGMQEHLCNSGIA